MASKAAITAAIAASWAQSISDSCLSVYGEDAAAGGVLLLPSVEMSLDAANRSACATLRRAFAHIAPQTPFKGKGFKNHGITSSRSQARV